MDASEAKKLVMSRIHHFDPENASKIMDYILIQDECEKKMNTLALCDDYLLQSFINQVKPHIALHFRSNSPAMPNDNGVFSLTAPPPPFLTSGARPTLQHFVGADGYLGDGVSFQQREVLPFIGDSFSSSGRSLLVNDSVFVAKLEEGGGGNGNVNGNGFSRRPCMYYARGFCKNGSSCRFLHVDNGGGDAVNGGLSTGFDESMKGKAFQQQRGDLPRSGSAASSSARQIYMTFPADSKFTEDDVFNYFRMFGPVQDVRIPHQDGRMFGFVTFLDPKTVEDVLAKGSPHYVCGSKVLVKPYKEKEKVKVREMKHQPLLDRGEYSANLSHRHHQDMVLRKSQEVELQHAMQLEAQRMLSLHLTELHARSIPCYSPVTYMNQRVAALCHSISEEFNGASVVADENLAEPSYIPDGDEASSDDSDFNESLAFFLPHNLLSSPTKSTVENQPVCAHASLDAGDVNASSPLPPPNAMASGKSPEDDTSLKSRYLQLPRRQEVIEM